MSVLVVAAFGIVFVVGRWSGMKAREADMRAINEQCARVVEDRAEIQARSIKSTFERVEAEKLSDRIMAEWMSRHPEDRFDFNVEEASE